MAVVEGSLAASAWVSSGDLLKHDRQDAHFGTETDLDVVLSSAIGPYPAGTTLATFLSGMANAFADLSSKTFRVSGLTAYAYIKGAHFSASAHIFDGNEMTGSFAAQWVVFGPTTAEFYASALLIFAQPGAPCL